jgi:hypothetical protein
MLTRERIAQVIDRAILQAPRINSVDWVVCGVRVEIEATRVTDRIAREEATA